MGAPGFMAYWIGGAVFLLEYTFWYAPELRAFALLVLQVDFALIMLSAGIYKYSAGYSLNNGMELGLVNPAWGYWWRKYAQVRPSHWVFRFMNQTAWMTEIAMAVLMIFPPTRLWGGLLMAMSFESLAWPFFLIFFLLQRGRRLNKGTGSI